MSNDLIRMDNFADDIDREKLKQYIFLIKDLTRKGKTVEEIAAFLCLVPSQVEIIKAHPWYMEMQDNDADDADIFRTALRSHLTTAADKLKKLVEAGDLQALKLFGQYIGADKPKEDTGKKKAENFLEVLRQLGLKSKEEEKKQKVIDAEYEEIDDEILAIDE